MCIFISIYFYISIHLSIHPFDLFSVTLLKVFCTTNLEPTVVSTTRVERAKMGQPARPQFGESQKVPKTVDAFTKGYTPQELENQQSRTCRITVLTQENSVLSVHCFVDALLTVLSPKTRNPLSPTSCSSFSGGRRWMDSATSC